MAAQLVGSGYYRRGRGGVRQEDTRVARWGYGTGGNSACVSTKVYELSVVEGGWRTAQLVLHILGDGWRLWVGFFGGGGTKDRPQGVLHINNAAPAFSCCCRCCISPLLQSLTAAAAAVSRVRL